MGLAYIYVMAYEDINFEDVEEEETEDEGEKEMSISEKRIADYVVNQLAKRKKKYPYPYPGKQTQEHEKQISELKADFEKKVSDLEKINSDLTLKLQEYEKVELDAKRDELFSVHLEKGLVTEEKKADFMKRYESFSGEQIVSLISTVKEFSAVKPEAKSFKGKEAGTEVRDFKTEMVELDSRIQEFGDAGLKVDDLIEEKEALKKEMKGN